jgi:hypothetical protein
MEHIITPYNDGHIECAWWDNGFTNEELNWLQDRTKLSSETAGVGLGIDFNIRRNKVSWLRKNEGEWVFNKLSHIVSSLNSQFFQLELVGFGEPVQLTHYVSEDRGEYTWHCDYGKGVSRKLSVVLQLSSPNDYEGGELHLKTGNEDTVVPKKRGMIVAFPSFTLHRVTPVTSGNRQTLVSWVSGPRFK